MTSPESDHLLYGRIAGAAAKHAAAWQLGGRGKAAAIAELAEASEGRADLLAKCAGLALGYGERQPDAGHYQRIAELCIAAGADKTLIERWIVAGQRRAAAGTASYSGYFPNGLTASGPGARTVHPSAAAAGPRRCWPARAPAEPHTAPGAPGLAQHERRRGNARPPRSDHWPHRTQPQPTSSPPRHQRAH